MNAMKIGGCNSCTMWGQKLQSKLIRRADVINRGFSGWTSRWALERIDDVLDGGLKDKGAETYMFATLWYGANDSQLKESSRFPRYYVSPEQYEDNMLNLGRKILAKTNFLIIIGVPPVSDITKEKVDMERWGQHEKLRDIENTRKYAEISNKVSETLKTEFSNKKISFVETFERFLPRKDDEAVLNDGLHFGPEGDDLVFEAIMSYLINRG